MVKKLVVISLAMAVIIGFAVWEMIFTTRLYSEILDGLYEIDRIVGDAPESVDGVEVRELSDKIMDRWNGAKNTLFCLGNHTILRLVDEKLVVLSATIKSNDTTTAPAAIKSAISLVKAVSNDDLPVPTNLF
ncbi:MAG: DUF4363 family protein [Clostridia bacterium]|nr:DUF4363 family protein [Clostridia bacterium]